MKNHFKILSTCLLSCLCTSIYAKNENSIIKPTLFSDINKKIKILNTSAVNTTRDDLNRINKNKVEPNLGSITNITKKFYNLDTISGTLNGRKIKIRTTGGTPIGLLTDAPNKKYDLKTKNSAIFKKVSDNNYVPLGDERVVIEADGQVIFDGNVITSEDFINIASTLGLLSVTNSFTSSSLNSISPSALSSNAIYDAADKRTLSHKEKAMVAKQVASNLGVSVADLKYEQARFTDTNEEGNVKGITLILSTMFQGVEVGVYIPYEHMDFDSFEGHKLGAIFYGKRDWMLPQHLKLTTIANFNSILTYIKAPIGTITYGGGISTALTYDDGGDFIPRVSFSAQYNTDYYIKANHFITDDEQYLIKTGASLGYRLFDNIALQTGIVYTRDITNYSTSFNRSKDKDFYSIKAGVTYTISNMWQVKLNYKHIMGLDSYYSNSIFLGTTMDF
jgi:hypothetical protein